MRRDASWGRCTSCSGGGGEALIPRATDYIARTLARTPHGHTAGRHRDGQRLGLGRHAACGPGADRVRYPPRMPGGLRTSHARPPLPVRGGGRRPGAAVHHRRRRWRRPPPGHAGRQDLAVPVLGVPVPSKHLNGLDSLLSIVQMPGGIPVATFAIGEAGARNAGLFAVALLARPRPGPGPAPRRLPHEPRPTRSWVSPSRSLRDPAGPDPRPARRGPARPDVHPGGAADGIRGDGARPRPRQPRRPHRPPAPAGVLPGRVGARDPRQGLRRGHHRVRERPSQRPRLPRAVLPRPAGAARRRADPGPAWSRRPSHGPVDSGPPISTPCSGRATVAGGIRRHRRPRPDQDGPTGV